MYTIVTGATGEIGFAISKELAKQKKPLILISKTEGRLEDACKSLSDTYENKNVGVCVDFTEIATLEGCLSTFQSIEGIVLNPPRIAASDQLFPSETEWIEAYRKVFFSPLHLLEQSIQKMDNKRLNKVVIISGISSVQVMSKYAINSSLRASWLAQAKTLSMNLSHVCINTLSLVGINTTLYREKLERHSQLSGKSVMELYEKDIENVPLKICKPG